MFAALHPAKLLATPSPRVPKRAVPEILQLEFVQGSRSSSRANGT